MRPRFADKVALITGAAGGIGLAAAQAFAAEGARVVLADRNFALAEQGAKAIADAGGNASAVFVDVSDPASCEAMVAHTLATFGALHIAFNNAGMPSAIGGAFEDFSVKDWDNLLATNLSGVFYAMKAQVPALKASGGGTIVNTASIAALIAAPGMAGYVASKHGVAGLTKAAALDLISHGIRVNAICPGFVDTPMLAGALEQPGARAAISAQTPIGRIASPQEIAQTALFLSSDASSYMVGALLSVDGGMTVQ